MITATEKEAFQSRGLLGIKSFLPPERVFPARQAALDPIGRFNLHKDILNLIGKEVYQAVAEFLDGRQALPQGGIPVALISPAESENLDSSIQPLVSEHPASAGVRNTRSRGVYLPGHGGTRRWRPTRRNGFASADERESAHPVVRGK